MEDIKGTVFDIQRFSVHDGPGIRTTVFLKGCNLRCFWCHNPESLSVNKQIRYFISKCVGCMACIKACSQNAIQIVDGKSKIDRDLCVECGVCAEACNYGALQVAGQTMSVCEVIDEVEKDKVFYETSGGGVTFSGGECLLQKDFIVELLKEAKARGIGTTIDTAGNVPYSTFTEILPYSDLFLYDVKAYDEDIHKKATGVSNKQILSNLKELSQNDTNIIIRIPVIPGVNDNVCQMDKISDLVKGLKAVLQTELLPFHGLAQGKYEELGFNYKAKHLKTPSKETVEKLADIFRVKNISVKTNK